MGAEKHVKKQKEEITMKQPKQKPNKLVVSTALTAEDYEKLFKFAEQVDVAVSKIVRRWIKEHLDNIKLMGEDYE